MEVQNTSSTKFSVCNCTIKCSATCDNVMLPASGTTNYMTTTGPLTSNHTGYYSTVGNHIGVDYYGRDTIELKVEGKVIFTMKIVDGKLEANYKMKDLGKAAQLFILEVLSQWKDN